MACEKLAKAILALAAGGDPLSHVAYSHLPYELARVDVAAKLGVRNFRRYRASLACRAPVFRAIDELNPAVGTQKAGGEAIFE